MSEFGRMMVKSLKKYAVGKDFTEADYMKWLKQLTWWITEKFPRYDDPKAHAEKVLAAAMNGTKLDGSARSGANLADDFFGRIKQFTGFDLLTGVGNRVTPRSKRFIVKNKDNTETRMQEFSLQDAMQLRHTYIQDLLGKYPHLDNPVYKPKVEELAETVIKSRMISTEFITSQGRQLEQLSKIRESLHKQIGELMSFLEIAPEQRVRKNLDAKNSDVGSLIAKLESYGEVWEEYEKIDAIRELIQLYRMLKSTRPDGTPQLNDWELWHMTRNRPVKFTCRHGETVELLGGFTPEEIEAALIQAQKTYGFGIEAINESISNEKPTDPYAIMDIAKAENFEANISLEPPVTEDNEDTSRDT